MRALLPVAATLALFFQTSTAHGQSVLLSEDFESGTSNWAVSGLFHLIDTSDVCAGLVAPFPSGTHVMHYGRTDVCNFDSNDLLGYLSFVAPITLPTGGSISLEFSTNSEAENVADGGWDRRSVQISNDGGVHWGMPAIVLNSDWQRYVVNLTTYAGQTIRLRFEFSAVDQVLNGGRGWFIDDVEIVHEPNQPGVPFCFGDECPCGNTGSAGNGCATSFNSSGANLTSSGLASVGADGVVLTASGLSNSVVTFFQGTVSTFGQGDMIGAFGDGRRCVVGTIVRIGAVAANAGSAQYPNAGDAPISLRGQLPSAGGRRYYQVWYRNAASFCTPSTFNMTNGLEVLWSP